MSRDSVTDDFRLSCAAMGSVELEITGPGESQTERRTIIHPSILLGGDARNDVQFHGSEIKPHHAYLQVIGGRVFYVSLARDRDTPGNRAAHCGWLVPERPFQVGEYSIRLLSNPGHLAQNGSVPRNPLRRVHSDADLARQELHFEFVGGRSSRLLWRMDRVLTLIGRARGCKIRLAHDEIADFQCALLYTPLGVWVIDLLGRGGVLRDGQPLRWARVQNGDRFQIGDFSLRPCSSRSGMDAVGGSLARAEAHGSGSALAPAPLVVRSEPPRNTEVSLAALRAGSLTLQAALMRSLSEELNDWKAQVFEQFRNSLMDMARMFYAQQQGQLDLLRQELSVLQQVTTKLDTLREVIETRFGPSHQSQALTDNGTEATNLSARPGHNSIEDQSREINSDSATATMLTPASAQAASERPSEAQLPAQAAPGAKPPSDIHAQLMKRLATLHRLRQGRLRRILQLITGG
jgi:hypothetical protein